MQVGKRGPLVFLKMGDKSRSEDHGKFSGISLSTCSIRLPPYVLNVHTLQPAVLLNGASRERVAVERAHRQVEDARGGGIDRQEVWGEHLHLVLVEAVGRPLEENILGDPVLVKNLLRDSHLLVLAHAQHVLPFNPIDPGAVLGRIVVTVEASARAPIDEGLLRLQGKSDGAQLHTFDDVRLHVGLGEVLGHAEEAAAGQNAVDTRVGVLNLGGEGALERRRDGRLVVLDGARDARADIAPLDEQVRRGRGLQLTAEKADNALGYGSSLRHDSSKWNDAQT